MISHLRIVEKPRRRQDDRWRRNLPSARRSRRGFMRGRHFVTAAVAVLALVAGLFYWQPSLAPFRLVSAALYGPGDTVARHFPLCGAGRRITCVVDGDTFWLDGVKIRLADINAPEVSAPACTAEAALGARATRRLQFLLNAGPFELTRGVRDEDRYRRKLRTAWRSGRSLGETLVDEGLAHRWLGYKQNWCE